MDEKKTAKLTTIAEFPRQFFLENLAVLGDNSLLVTVANRLELWFVPPPSDTVPVEPVKLHTFAPYGASGIVEAEPDVFYISVGGFYNSDEAFIYRLDLREWVPGTPVAPQPILQFPKTVRGLNGSCLLAPGVMLLADSFLGAIWRVDLSANGTDGKARIWLEHESMRYYPGTMKPEQPGINGIRYAEASRYVYYTSTAKKLFMRVPVDKVTSDPAGDPEHVAVGRMWDDFCLDESAGVAYTTTHRENTIERVSLDPSRNNLRSIIAGNPFNEQLIGPSSGAWSRNRGDYGKVAFFLTDGGTASPAPGGLRTAKLLRVDVPSDLEPMH